MPSSPSDLPLRKKSLRRAVWQSRLDQASDPVRFSGETERNATQILRSTARASLREGPPVASIGACPVYTLPADWRTDTLRQDPSINQVDSEEELISLLEKNGNFEIFAAAHLTLDWRKLSYQYPHSAGKILYLEAAPEESFSPAAGCAAE